MCPTPPPISRTEAPWTSLSATNCTIHSAAGVKPRLRYRFAVRRANRSEKTDR